MSALKQSGTVSALLLAACLARAQDAPRMPQDEFKKALGKGTILAIDVRDAQSYANGHIPGALSFPITDLERRLPELKAAKKPIVAYCA